MNRIKHGTEAILFNGRWLVAPFLLGLVAGLATLLYKFLAELANVVVQVQIVTPADVIVSILRLVDLTLVANLIMIVICSSYENFLAPIGPREHANLPKGLMEIGFSALKQKLIGSIVAIAAVNVLEWFMHLDQAADNGRLIWVVGILMALALAMLVLAVADRVSNDNENEVH